MADGWTKQQPTIQDHGWNLVEAGLVDSVYEVFQKHIDGFSIPKGIIEGLLNRYFKAKETKCGGHKIPIKDGWKPAKIVKKETIPLNGIDPMKFKAGEIVMMPSSLRESLIRQGRVIELDDNEMSEYEPPTYYEIKGRPQEETSLKQIRARMTHVVELSKELGCELEWLLKNPTARDRLERLEQKELLPYGNKRPPDNFTNIIEHVSDLGERVWELHDKMWAVTSLLPGPPESRDRKDDKWPKQINPNRILLRGLIGLYEDQAERLANASWAGGGFAEIAADVFGVVTQEVFSTQSEIDKLCKRIRDALADREADAIQ